MELHTDKDLALFRLAEIYEFSYTVDQRPTHIISDTPFYRQRFLYTFMKL